MEKRKQDNDITNTTTGFTWNLNQEQLNLEEGINLRKSINFSCKNLEEFKYRIEREIFDTLGFDVNALKDATKKQIDKNEINRNIKINKIMSEFYRKEEEVKSEKDGTDFLEAEIELNNQKNKELTKALTLSKNIDTIQGDLKKQKGYLTVLTSTEIWKTLLSLPEDETPRIKFNVINYDNNSNSVYEIRKQKEYEKGDCTDAIRNTIRDKLYEINNKIIEENSEECIDFALKYILKPFSTSKGYDNETLKYYTYSILDYIQNKNIIQDIVSEYIVRKDMALRLAQLEEDLKSYGNNIKYLEKQSDQFEHEPTHIGEDLDRLKMRSFISYLESSNNNLKNKKDIIKRFKEKFENKKKCEFNEKWLQIDTPVFEYIQGPKDKENFITVCVNILKFLNIDKDKTEEIEALFNNIGNPYKGKLDYLSGEKLLNSLKEEITITEKKGWLIGHVNGHEVGKWKDGDKIGIERKKLEKYLESNIIDRLPDRRPNIINKLFYEIFGIKFKSPDLNNLNTGGKNDLDLLWSMLENLVSKINENKQYEISSINDQIKEITKQRLSEKSDTAISGICKNRLDKLINETVRDTLKNHNIDIKKEEKRAGKLKKILLDRDKELKKSNIEKIKEQILPDLEGVSAILKGSIKKFEGYAKGKKDEIYDLNTITDIDDPSKHIKKLVCLINLFQCDQLTLEDKFYYSKIILGFKESDPNDVIKSKDEKHDSILKKIFRDNMVKPHYESKKLSEILSQIKINKPIVFDENETVDAQYITNGLGQTEKTVHRINEIIGLSILKADLVDKNSKIKDLEGLNESEKDEWQEMIEKEIDDIKNEYEKNLLIKFKAILEKLGIDKENLKEIDKLNDLFPGALEGYIRNCLGKQALKFGESKYAINYRTGEIDFSVIRAGILENAVEKGNLKKVLEYLGFFTKKNFDIPKKALNNEVLKNTIKGIIQLLQEGILDSEKEIMVKYGCFSDKYPNSNRQILRFQENSLINIKKTACKFCIGKEDDQFRIVGVRNKGLYVIYYYFYTNKQHEKEYKQFLNGGISKNDKEIFRECTGIDFDSNDKS